MGDRRRRQNPPPVKCQARAKRTGEPCRRWAIPGRVRCKHHGGYAGPHEGRSAVEEQVAGALTLAQMMASHPGRPVWEVVLDSIRTVDILAQAARDEVAAGRVADPEGIERVASLARLAHSMAASAVATKALDIAAQSAEKWADLVSVRLAALLSDWIGLEIPAHGLVSAGLSATLGGLDLSTPPGAPPSPDGPPLLERVGRAVASALAPRLGIAPEAVAGWFTALVRAVDTDRPAPDLPVPAVAALPPAPERRADPMAALDEPDPDPSGRPAPVEALTVECQADPSGHPDPSGPEPEVLEGELVDTEPEPEPRMIWDPERKIRRRNPNYRAPASNGRRITTSLGYGGSRPDDRIGSYRTFT